MANNRAMFTLLDGSKTDLKFKNLIPESIQMNSMSYEYYYNGAGVAVGDVTKDGLPDVFLIGNVTPNKLYKNLGNFKFQDITIESGLKDTPSWSTGTTMVDINGDGIMDIYVCRSGKLPENQRENQFFVSEGIKDGHPIYKNRAQELGLNDAGYSTQAIFFDFDLDGDLDMFLLNHNIETKPFYNVEELKRNRDQFVGDKLFRNENGKFKDVSNQAGIKGNEIGYGLGVSIGDLNNDGWPDIYVANDYSEHDYLYINNRDGTYSDRSSQSLGHMSNYSMGTDIADFNNDGMLDIITLDMVAEDNYGIKTSMSGMNPELFQTHLDNGLQHQYMYNALQVNRGNQLFSDVAQLAGVHSTDWSWAPLFLDVDLDGLKDLFVTNGLKRDFRNNDYRNYKINRLEEAEENDKLNRKDIIMELVSLTPKKKISNYVFKNSGGLKFTNKQEEWGIDVASYSNGLAYADFDQDGDFDLITNNIDETPLIYKNNAREINENNFISINLAGSNNNIDGIGARVSIWLQGNIQIQEQFLTRGYQSSVNKGLIFGLGKNDKIDSVQVKWVDGKTELLKNIDSNQFIELQYSNANLKETNNHSKPQFRDISKTSSIIFKHKETLFDDFQRESLLPHKMSELGPGLAVADINDDGLDDVFVGGARGFSGELFIQTEKNKFEKSSTSPWGTHRNSEDMSAIFFDANGDNQLDLYVVSGSNESDIGSSDLKDRLYINKKGNFTDASHLLPNVYVSGFTVEAFDYDADGDQDLFVGGRQYPGKYPLPVSSYLLNNNDGRFTNVTDDVAPELKDIGMVTDAVWADYNSDGLTDLIVVGEWMPMTIFLNSGNKFSLQNTSGTENSTGWWNCILADDFDHDGDLDFVLGNNGLNYKYKATKDEPFDIYAADFDKNGSLDIVLGYYNDGNQFPLRGRQCTSNQMPFVKEKFPTYHDFGVASLSDVFDQSKLDSALQYHAKTFASAYVENKGIEGFDFHKLPEWAQISSVNKIIAEDLNNDNHLDLILGGNLYQSEVETPRNDAGFGLVLLGNGNGEFSTVDAHESGLYIGGDVKDMNMIHLGNGRSGILIAKNNDYLQLLEIKSD